MTTELKLKQIPFDVQIPNLDGDGIAQTIRIEVTAYADPESGEDILTPESLELIERTQARHMGVMAAARNQGAIAFRGSAFSRRKTCPSYCRSAARATPAGNPAGRGLHVL